MHARHIVGAHGRAPRLQQVEQNNGRERGRYTPPHELTKIEKALVVGVRCARDDDTCRVRETAREGVLDELTKAVTFSDNSSYMRAHLAYGYAVSGDLQRAEAIGKELEEEGRMAYVAPYHLALIAAGLGDVQGAARWLTTM